LIVPTGASGKKGLFRILVRRPRKHYKPDKKKNKIIFKLIHGRKKKEKKKERRFSPCGLM
jgi:hypothetical protein